MSSTFRDKNFSSSTNFLSRVTGLDYPCVFLTVSWGMYQEMALQSFVGKSWWYIHTSSWWCSTGILKKERKCFLDIQLSWLILKTYMTGKVDKTTLSSFCCWHWLDWRAVEKAPNIPSAHLTRCAEYKMHLQEMTVEHRVMFNRWGFSEDYEGALPCIIQDTWQCAKLSKNLCTRRKILSEILSIEESNKI